MQSCWKIAIFDQFLHDENPKGATLLRAGEGLAKDFTCNFLIFQANNLIFFEDGRNGYLNKYTKFHALFHALSHAFMQFSRNLGYYEQFWPNFNMFGV